MKKLATLSTVIALHIAVIGMIFIQPGCGSTSEEKKPDAQSQATEAVDMSDAISDGSANAPEADALAAQDAQQAQSPLPEGSIGLRAAPTRPSGTWNMNGGGKVIVEDTPAQAAPAADKPVNAAPEAKSSPTLKLSIYKVQKGDSLWSIAKKHNVPFGEILKANGMDSNSKIKIGQEIQIPSLTKPAESATAAIAVQAPKGAAAAGQDSQKSDGKETVYIVRKGDSLSKIAAMHRVKVSQIKKLNGLFGDMVRIGQKLKIPEGAKAAASQPASGAKAAAGETVHVVTKGETLGAIARKYGTTVSKISTRNSIKDPRKIRIGQKIIVPSAQGAAKPAAEASAAPAAPAAQQKAESAPAQPQAPAEGQPSGAQQPASSTGINVQADSAATVPVAPAAEAAQPQQVETVEVIKADQPAAPADAQGVKTEGGTEVIDL